METKRNFNSVFLRDVTVALLAELHEKLHWYNTWSNETRKIEVPFYYSLTGDDRFLLDAFVDDIPGKRIEQNYDKVPRGVLSLEQTTVRSNEQSNPNVRINRYIEETDPNSVTSLKRVISKMRSLPLTITYEIRIRVASEIDIFKCQEAIWDLIFQYQFFYFDHDFMRIEAFFKIPDEVTTKINREVNMQSDIYFEKSFRLEVQTSYPIFGEIERVPTTNRVTWQNDIWRLKGSGAENQSEPKNAYPPEGKDRSGKDRNDRLPNPNDGLK